MDLWHLEKFRARAKNTKTHFPGARGTFGGEIRPPKKCPFEIPQLFCTICVLADRTPTGGQTRNDAVAVHFGLGQPLALGKIPQGPGRAPRQKGSRNKMACSKNDTGPFGASLEVVVACAEALVGHRDLRRVVRFTHAHDVRSKRCVPFKGRSVGSNGVLLKRENTSPLQLGPREG